MFQRAASGFPPNTSHDCRREVGEKVRRDRVTEQGSVPR